MIIWGGWFGSPLGSGARYDIDADTWTPLAEEDAPDGVWMHGAVWTGNDMVVWGGLKDGQVWSDEGGRYRPGPDAWEMVTVEGAPSPRYSPGTAWAETGMLIWGGNRAWEVGSTGGIYCTGPPDGSG